MRLLVTGGAGYIGSTFVARRLRGAATRSSSSTS
jgi:nucleoside-diphosphate-sugar epimerase